MWLFFANKYSWTKHWRSINKFSVRIIIHVFFAYENPFPFSPCWAHWEDLVMCFSNEEERTSQQNTVCNFCCVSIEASEPMLRLSLPWQEPQLRNTGRHRLLGMENLFEVWNQSLPWKSWIPQPSLYAQWQHDPVNFLLLKYSMLTSPLCEMSYRITLDTPWPLWPQISVVSLMVNGNLVVSEVQRPHYGIY
jgi:hypothetical protein